MNMHLGRSSRRFLGATCVAVLMMAAAALATSGTSVRASRAATTRCTVAKRAACPLCTNNSGRGTATCGRVVLVVQAVAAPIGRSLSTLASAARHVGEAFAIGD